MARFNRAGLEQHLQDAIDLVDEIDSLPFHKVEKQLDKIASSLSLAKQYLTKEEDE